MTLREYVTAKLPAPLITGFIAFIFYVSCLSPTVTYGGDCGELIAASWNAAIPHPTGYPLYAMLGWLFAHLVQWGEVAWRYNLFSALTGGICVGLAAAATGRLTQNRFAAITAALSLAGLYFFASQHVIAEVYSLNSALLALMFYAAIRWRLDREWRWLAVLALGVGLIPNAHLSGIYLLPGLAVFLWPRHPKVLLKQHYKRLTGLMLLAILGFSCTLYLPWRSRQFAPPAAGPDRTLLYQPLDWGHPANAQNWWNHITARQYRFYLWKQRDIHLGDHVFTVPVFARPLSHSFDQMRVWSAAVALQYLWIIFFTLWGAVACWKWMPKLGWLLWLTFVLDLFFQSNYNVSNVGDIANFLFPCYIVLALWTGLGVHHASKVLLTRPLSQQRLGRLALWGLTFSAVLAQWIMVYPVLNQRHITRARDTALQRARDAELLYKQTGRPPALLMTQDDTLFPFWYIQKVQHRAAAATTPWGPFRHYYSDQGKLVTLVRQLQKQGPVAVTEWHQDVAEAFPLVPLDSAGSLWLASTRILPEPAKVLSAIPRAAVNPKLHFTTLHVPSNIKPCELFAATLEMNYFPDKSTFITKRDAAHRSIQHGWIEVAYAAPLPSHKYGPQDAIPSIARQFKGDQISQRIPLVVPDNLQHPVRIQMTLPLQVPRTFAKKPCEIWLNTGNSSWDYQKTVRVVH